MRITIEIIKNIGIIVIACTILQGCWRSPGETETHVLSTRRTLVHNEKLVINTAKPMRVIGSRSAVCFVVAYGVSAASQESLKQVLNRNLMNAAIEVQVDIGGKRVKLLAPHMAWMRDGVFGHAGELATCFRLAPTDAQVGSVFNILEIKSSKTIHIIGIYWLSTSAYDGWH